MTFYFVSSFLFITTGLKETDSDSTGDGEDDNEKSNSDKLRVTSDVLNTDEVEDLFDKDEAIIAFLLLVMPDVIGRMKFRRFWDNCEKRCYTDLLDVTDEGFGLLVLENNREKWTDEVNRMRNNGIGRVTDSLYTRHAKKNQRDENSINMPARKEGWSHEGIKRFNTLCRHVNEMRGDKEKVNRVNALIRARVALEMTTESEGDSKRNRRKRKRQQLEQEQEEEVPFSSNVLFD